MSAWETAVVTGASQMANIPQRLSRDCPLRKLLNDSNARIEFEKSMLRSHQAEVPKIT